MNDKTFYAAMYLRLSRDDGEKQEGVKLETFAAQTNNVYVNRIGDYVVKVRYQKTGPTIDEKMEEYIRRLSEVYI